MKYLLVEAEHTNIINFDDVMEKSLESSRWNRDKTMVVLKCKGNIPTWYVNRAIYTHEHIIKLMQTYKWSSL
jgi:hypothetical protein